MPNFSNMREKIKGAEHPLIVFLTPQEIAKASTAMSVFSDTDFIVISNREKMFSPVDGKPMTRLPESRTEVASAEFASFDDLVTLYCEKCEERAGIDPDLAFELAGEDICCPACGKQTKLVYDLAADNTDEDEDEDTAETDDEESDDAEIEDADIEDDESESDEDDTTYDTDESDDESVEDAEMSTDDDEDEESETAAYASIDEVLAAAFTGDEDSDEQVMSDIESFIMDENTSAEDRRRALYYLLSTGMGEDVGDENNITDEDVADFMSEAENYDGEMASLSANLLVNKHRKAKKAARKTRRPAKETASNDEEFTTNTGDKKLFDKAKGQVTVFVDGDDEPECAGRLLRVLKNDTFLIETDDNPTQKLVVKGNVSGMHQETARIVANSDGDIQPAKETASEEAPAPAETEKKVEETDVSDEKNDIVVDAISLADENANINLVALNGDASEIAAFIGTTHVGTLDKRFASESTVALYDNSNRLASAFRAAFSHNRQSPDSSELASFGFKPTKFTVRVGDLFKQRLAREVAAATKEEPSAIAGIEDFGNVVELAFVGINKGVFDGENDFGREIASLLRRNGVQNAEHEVRRVLATTSHNYVKAAINKAKELATRDVEYLNGVSETIAKAEFIGEGKPDLAPESTPRPAPEPKKEVAGVFGAKPQTPTGNRYEGIIGSLGRR